MLIRAPQVNGQPHQQDNHHESDQPGAIQPGHIGEQRGEPLDDDGAQPAEEHEQRRGEQQRGDRDRCLAHHAGPPGGTGLVGGRAGAERLRAASEPSADWSAGSADNRGIGGRPLLEHQLRQDQCNGADHAPGEHRDQLLAVQPCQPFAIELAVRSGPAQSDIERAVEYLRADDPEGAQHGERRRRHLLAKGHPELQQECAEYCADCPEAGVPSERGPMPAVKRQRGDAVAREQHQEGPERGRSKRAGQERHRVIPPCRYGAEP